MAAHHARSNSAKRDSVLRSRPHSSRPLSTRTSRHTDPPAVRPASAVDTRRYASDCKHVIETSMIVWLWVQEREKDKLGEIMQDYHVWYAAFCIRANKVSIEIHSKISSDLHRNTSTSLAQMKIESLMKKYEDMRLQNRDVSEYKDMAERWKHSAQINSSVYLCGTPDGRHLLIGPDHKEVERIYNSFKQTARQSVHNSAARRPETDVARKDQSDVRSTRKRDPKSSTGHGELHKTSPDCNTIRLKTLLWMYLSHVKKDQIADVTRHYEVEAHNDVADKTLLVVKPHDEGSRSIVRNLQLMIDTNEKWVQYETLDFEDHSLRHDINDALGQCGDIYYSTNGRKVTIAATAGLMFETKEKIRAIVKAGRDTKKSFHSPSYSTTVKTPTPSDRSHDASAATASTAGAQGKMSHSFKGTDIFIYQANITKLSVDGIVNAANDRLDHIGGIAAAISDAAGYELQMKCAEKIRRSGRLDVSDVYVTPGYALPCHHVLHVVGPSSLIHKQGSGPLLYKAFRNCLNEADTLKLTSVAIPAVSSGVYRVPMETVCAQLYKAIVDHLKIRTHGYLKEIHLVDYSTEFVCLIDDQFTNHLPKENLTEPLTSRTVSTDRENNSRHEANDRERQRANDQSRKDSKDRERVYTTRENSKDKERYWSNVSAHDGDKDGKQKHRQEELTQVNQKRSDDTCCICMEDVVDEEHLPCGHKFCRDCIRSWTKLKPTCPECGHIFGELTGDQPKDGTMEVSISKSRLPGHETDSIGTIKIDYEFQNGKQGSEHPNPGAPYSGTRRRAYLPDNPRGNKVLKLLQRAFGRRLTFTIGRSTTSNRDNQVTWNDIHHKTNKEGGPQRYGYPDPTYLDRVEQELADKGIK